MDSEDWLVIRFTVFVLAMLLICAALAGIPIL